MSLNRKDSPPSGPGLGDMLGQESLPSSHEPPELDDREVALRVHGTSSLLSSPSLVFSTTPAPSAAPSATLASQFHLRSAVASRRPIAGLPPSLVPLLSLTGGALSEGRDMLTTAPQPQPRYTSGQILAKSQQKPSHNSVPLLPPRTRDGETHVVAPD